MTSRVASLVVLITIIVVLGSLFWRVMSSFFVPLFLAALLVVIFRPLYDYVLDRTRGRPRLSAGLTTGAITLIVLLPCVWIVSLAVVQGVKIVTHSDVSTLQNQLQRMRANLRLEVPDVYFDFRQAADELAALAITREPHPERVKTLAQLVDRIRSQAYGSLDKDDPLRDPDAAGGPSQGAESQEASPTGGGGEKGDDGKGDDGKGEAGDDKAGKDKAGDEESGAEESGAEARPPLQPLDEVRQALRAAMAHADGGLEYAESLDRAWARMEQCRLQMLGGPLRAWIKESVNPSDEQLSKLKGDAFAFMRSWLLTLSSNTLAVGARLILGGVIVIIALFFFFLDGPAMVRTVMWLSPLDDRHELELLDEFTRVSRAVVVATLLSALVQAILAGVGFLLSGFGSAAILLMLLTFVFAMIPFFGAAAVWFPCTIYLYIVEERTLAAVLLLLYGVGVISALDNVIKPWVLHGQSNLHPLFALLSVLGGVQALGPIGLLIGPMVVAFLQTMLKILHRELTGREDLGGELAGEGESGEGESGEGESGEGESGEGEGAAKRPSGEEPGDSAEAAME